MSEFYDAFEAEVKEKIAPHKTLSAWVKEHPGEHLWATMRGVVSCAACGKCKREDGKPQKPCTGVTRIGLRR